MGNLRLNNLVYFFSVTISSNNCCELKDGRSLDASHLLYGKACSFFHCKNTTKLNVEPWLRYLNETIHLRALFFPVVVF